MSAEESGKEVVFPANEDRMKMAIKVRLQLLEGGDSRGVRLWAIALDGSGRSWFKWYEDHGTAMIDSEAMRLVETPVEVTPSNQRYISNVRRRLLSEPEIEEEALDTYWHKSATAPK
jgi:hypothetical protein